MGTLAAEASPGQRALRRDSDAPRPSPSAARSALWCRPGAMSTLADGWRAARPATRPAVFHHYINGLLHFARVPGRESAPAEQLLDIGAAEGDPGRAAMIAGVGVRRRLHL